MKMTFAGVLMQMPLVQTGNVRTFATHEKHWEIRLAIGPRSEAVRQVAMQCPSRKVRQRDLKTRRPAYAKRWENRFHARIQPLDIWRGEQRLLKRRIA